MALANSHFLYMATPQGSNNLLGLKEERQKDTQGMIIKKKEKRKKRTMVRRGRKNFK